MTQKIAAWLFIGLLIPVIALQLGLALGMPWGELAMGGQFPGQFPLPMRVAALVQSALLLFIGAIVLAHSGVALKPLLPLSKRLMWGVVVLCALAAVLNLITPSTKERDAWLPVAAGLLLCSAVVALCNRSKRQ